MNNQYLGNSYILFAFNIKCRIDIFSVMFLQVVKCPTESVIHQSYSKSMHNIMAARTKRIARMNTMPDINLDIDVKQAYIQKSHSLNDVTNNSEMKQRHDAFKIRNETRATVKTLSPEKIPTDTVAIEVSLMTPLEKVEEENDQEYTENNSPDI